MIQAFKGTGLKPTERLVAYMLADHHNDTTSRCDPSVALLAEETGLDERSVSRAIRRMEETGHLTVRRNGGTRNSYDLHPRQSAGAPPAESHPRHKVTPGRESVLPPAESPGYPRHRVGTPPAQSPLNRKEPETKPEGEPEDLPPASDPPKDPKPNSREADIAEAGRVPVPLELNTPDFRAAWAEWHAYRSDLFRRDRAKVWTAVASKNMLLQCARHGPEISAMAINAAIGNSWRSLVWDRLQVNPSNPNATHPRNNRPPVTRNVEPLPPNPRSLNSTAADYSERVAALQRSGAPDDGNSSF